MLQVFGLASLSGIRVTRSHAVEYLEEKAAGACLLRK